MVNPLWGPQKFRLRQLGMGCGIIIGATIWNVPKLVSQHVINSAHEPIPPLSPRMNNNWQTRLHKKTMNM